MNSPIISLSTAVYGLLLFAYPARFRRHYGLEMAGVFLDSCLRSYRQSGGIGMIELWVVTLFDLARSLIEQHSQKETGMPNSNFIRLSGWAFIVGAVFFLPGAVGMLLWDTRYAFDWSAAGMQAVGLAAFLAPVLLAVGLLGLRSRYGREAGSLARWVLLGGALVGGALVIVGELGQWFATSSSMSETYYYVWGWGLLVVLGSLFIFGVVALIRKPLPRWNGLPLVAGGLAPLLGVLIILEQILGQIIVFESQRRLVNGAVLAIGLGALVLMTFALVVLGYVLQSDARRDQPAFA
jgi:hypothetical protein